MVQTSETCTLCPSTTFLDPTKPPLQEHLIRLLVRQDESRTDPVAVVLGIIGSLIALANLAVAVLAYRRQRT